MQKKSHDLMTLEIYSLYLKKHGGNQNNKSFGKMY